MYERREIDGLPPEECDVAGEVTSGGTAWCIVNGDVFVAVRICEGGNGSWTPRVGDKVIVDVREARGSREGGRSVRGCGWCATRCALVSQGNGGGKKGNVGVGEGEEEEEEEEGGEREEDGEGGDDDDEEEDGRGFRRRRGVKENGHDSQDDDLDETIKQGQALRAELTEAEIREAKKEVLYPEYPLFLASWEEFGVPPKFMAPVPRP